MFTFRGPLQPSQHPHLLQPQLHAQYLVVQPKAVSGDANWTPFQANSFANPVVIPATLKDFSGSNATYIHNISYIHRLVHKTLRWDFL